MVFGPFTVVGLVGAFHDASLVVLVPNQTLVLGIATRVEADHPYQQPRVWNLNSLFRDPGAWGRVNFGARLEVSVAL